MLRKVTTAGFYGGKFLSVGQSYDDGVPDPSAGGADEETKSADADAPQKPAKKPKSTSS